MSKKIIEKIISKNLYISLFVLLSLTVTANSYLNLMGSFLNSDAGGVNNDNWNLEGDYTFQSAAGNSLANGSTIAKLEGEVKSELFGDFSFGLSNSDIEFKKTSRNDCGTGTTYSISGTIKSFEAWGNMDFDETVSYYCPANGEWSGKLYSDRLGNKFIKYGSGTNLLGASFNLENQVLVKGVLGTNQNVNINGNLTNSSQNNSQITKILQISIPKSDITKNINKNINVLTKNINPINKLANPGSFPGMTSDNTIGTLQKETYYFNFEKEENSSASNENNKGKIIEIKNGNYNTTNLTDYQVSITGQKNLIVKGGNVYINADIYNTDKNSLLVIVAKRDPSNIKNGGNIYINPNVTNIDAVLIAEGSIINYNGSVVTSIDNLRNQLYIYGSTFTKNSIGIGINPYGSDGYIKFPTDLTNGSDKYDLTKLRSFDLIVSNTGTLDNDGNYDCSSNANNLVPRLDNTMKAKKYSWAGKRKCFKTDATVTNLRGINRFNPLIIEYNPIISTNPPFILKNN